MRFDLSLAANMTGKYLTLPYMRFISYTQKLLNGLFSTRAAGLYLLLIAAAIGAATFIENDFGTSAAQKVVFKTRWFEVLLVLFGLCLLYNIWRFRMVQQKKWALLSFHASMVIILAGAGITRYFGYEGMMGIREGQASDTFLSSETFLQFDAVHNGRRFRFAEPVLFASLGDNSFAEDYRLAGRDIRVEVLEFLPNPTETVTEDPEHGVPVLKVVIGGTNGREEYQLPYGELSNIRGTLFNFGNAPMPEAFNIRYAGDSLMFMSGGPFAQMQMATQRRDTLPPGVWHPLLLRSLYSDGLHNFVLGDFQPKGRVSVTAGDPKMTKNSEAALRLAVSCNGETRHAVVRGMQGTPGKPQVFPFGDLQLAISYGSMLVKVPFSIRLNDFIMEKYPGTTNASSYASEVTLMDPAKGHQRDQRIYMNHILDYRGYRFFQSSYDPDELGTYLSVNHDFWGTLVSYVGYAILTIGMLLTMFDKRSRFRHLNDRLKEIRMAGNRTFLFFWACCLLPVGLFAESHVLPAFAIPSDHAADFGHLVVQDHQGRLKPMNTYASEFLRKLSRKESLYGQTAEQIILGMMTYPRDWYHVPLVKLGKHEELRHLIPIQGDLAAYSDFFDTKGQYVLQELARKAYSTESRERNVFEKEIIKLDERVNICSMIFSGNFLRMFPVPGDANNTWEAPAGHHAHDATPKSDRYSERFFQAYVPTLQKALRDNDWSLANRLLSELQQHQKQTGSAVLPSDAKIKSELLLNKLNIFNRMGLFTGLLALVFLGLLFASVFAPHRNLQTPFRVAQIALALGFLVYTFGLGLRWYVSGRAPWSNGYESMVYIGWTTTLAGLIFARKSAGGLAATMTLVATILMVAGMNWLDPEITPLVPVLKSYWLMIHVSLEAGSYGFLVLGAIIGVLNLLFMIFANAKNRENVYRMIRELSYVSEMTLIGGLCMISIGTYLGGVWANESWGRYWGWDAKETWALVTILVYAFILHMRLIPGLRGLYAYNLATLFGWASVMMTYFGVNYYLSGLHSYAAGDPVPVPPFIYYSVAILTVIALAAYWKDRKVTIG